MICKKPKILEKILKVKIQLQIEYQKKGKEINENCKAYQKLTPENHPLVKQAKKVGDLASEVSFQNKELTNIELSISLIALQKFYSKKQQL